MATNGHAKFSPSAAHRWLSCPGSIQLSENAPPQVESIYAKEGTDAHAALEMILKNPPQKLNEVRKLMLAGNKFSLEMVNHAEQAAYEIRRRVPEGATLLSETKADLSFISPDLYGTADAVIIEDFGRMTVIDYKYGAGIAVDPEDNPQLVAYALGVAHQYEYNFSEIELMVIQPRADHHSGETIRSSVITIEELEAWKEKFIQGIAACDDPLAVLQAGEWCRFCPAKAICPQISDLALRTAQVDFAPVALLQGEVEPGLSVQLPAVKTLHNLGHVLDACELLEAWIDGVRSHAFHVMESGGHVDGYKLVAKMARRLWKDEVKTQKDALKYFGKDTPIYSEPELLSPAQFEKTIKGSKDWVAIYSEKVSNGITFAPESDKRPAIDMIRRDFGEIETVDAPAAKITLPAEVAEAKSKAKSKPNVKTKTKAKKAKVAKKSRRR